MKFSDQMQNLRIELDAKQCELPAEEIRRLENSLSPLRKLIEPFPVADLYITVQHHPRSTNYGVRTALVLTGQTLVSDDEDAHVHPAFERCVTNLVEQVKAYKNNLGAVDERTKFQKGSYQEVLPEQEPDGAAIQQAHESGDYAEFRKATLGFEEPLRKRIGRLVARYPEIDEQIGARMNIADIVEAVFLSAFDNFQQRPANLRFGDWLESLIDRAVKDLQQNPDAELENIRMAQSLHDLDPPPAASNAPA